MDDIILCRRWKARIYDIILTCHHLFAILLPYIEKVAYTPTVRSVNKELDEELDAGNDSYFVFSKDKVSLNHPIADTLLLYIFTTNTICGDHKAIKVNDDRS